MKTFQNRMTIHGYDSEQRDKKPVAPVVHILVGADNLDNVQAFTLHPDAVEPFIEQLRFAARAAKWGRTVKLSSELNSGLRDFDAEEVA